MVLEKSPSSCSVADDHPSRGVGRAFAFAGAVRKLEDVQPTFLDGTAIAAAPRAATAGGHDE